MPRTPASSPTRLFVLLLAVLLAASAIVRADPTTPPNPGPDVIVGDLPDCTSYGTVGATNIYAFSFGTTSCNVGNVNIRWQAATPYHPVIAQNIYRLRSGRFEQIGMSWVKHGFFASNQTLCGVCNMQGGSTLGVGCSDPYDNGVNGDQSGLGPRSEVNASTGSFPFFVNHNWPPIADALSRRIRIAGADLALPANAGAQYFAEAIYITPDDAGANLGWNNATYRPVTFDTASPTFAMALTGTPRRTRPALFAWQAIDPGVRIAGFDVPSDGRFLLAHSVTGNGGSPPTWHYEYALFNLNSDRSGGGFTVPIPSGASVTNAEFRSCPSHSGEPYSNAPWTISINPNGISFAPAQSFADDPNGNALRWGSTDTFRFDCDAPPADGSVSIALFKPGAGLGGLASLNSFALNARTPGGALTTPAAPINDDCSGAYPVHTGENRSCTLGATGSAPGACVPIAGDVWFTYTFTPYAPNCPPTPGNITLDTCGSNFDTSIAVYGAPTCPPAPNSELACNDDAPSPCVPTSSGASSVTFPATPGATYLIRVGSPSGATGNLVLNLAVPFCIAPSGACCLANGACQFTQGPASCYGGAFNGAGTSCSPNPCPQPPPPANDQCAGAIPIGDSSAGSPALSGNNFAADNTVNDVCDFGAQGQRDVWYQYTPALTGPVVIDTCTFPLFPSGSGLMDTLLSIHEGSCAGPRLACNDDAFGFCVPGSRITPTLTARTNYFIRVAGYSAVSGEFVLRVSGGGGTARGACCWGSACSLATPATCTGPDHHFAGLSTLCNPSTFHSLPCCQADFNHVNMLSVQDIFDFLDAWFALSPSAAVGGNTARTPIVQDIFDFLSIWFAGC